MAEKKPSKSSYTTEQFVVGQDADGKPVKPFHVVELDERELEFYPPRDMAGFRLAAAAGSGVESAGAILGWMDSCLRPADRNYLARRMKGPDDGITPELIMKIFRDVMSAYAERPTG